MALQHAGCAEDHQEDQVDICGLISLVPPRELLIPLHVQVHVHEHVPAARPPVICPPGPVGASSLPCHLLGPICKFKLVFFL